MRPRPGVAGRVSWIAVIDLAPGRPALCAMQQALAAGCAQQVGRGGGGAAGRNGRVIYDLCEGSCTFVYASTTCLSTLMVTYSLLLLAVTSSKMRSLPTK